MKFNKKEILITLSLLIVSIISIIFVNNNFIFYKDTLVKITNVENKLDSTSSNTLGLSEKYYKQKITGTILNTDKKGKIIHIENEATTSNVVTDNYEKGDIIFVDLDKNIVNGLKRDNYIVLLVIIFILSIYLVGRKQGIFSVISVILNTLIFYYGLKLYLKGVNLLLLVILESIVFTCISLFIVSGKNKKTISAIISVLVSLLVLFLIAIIVILTTNYSGISFNGMSYITVPVEEVFVAELLIGGLGAIMDVSITMSSSISELIEKNNKISIKALIRSGKEIGNDIMGTMINVLFFTYLCSGLPIFVLAVRNGFSVYNYITTNFSLEITRFLVGSIGIVLAIPIGLYISIRILKGGKNEFSFINNFILNNDTSRR